MRQTKPGPHLMQFLHVNPLSETILKEFTNEESADVVFEVGGEQVGTPSANFHAHRSILKGCAPTLAYISGSGEDMTPISITDVKPEIFHHNMLYYIYGGKLSDDDLKANAMAIIDVVDRYEFGGGSNPCILNDHQH